MLCPVFPPAPARARERPASYRHRAIRITRSHAFKQACTDICLFGLSSLFLGITIKPFYWLGLSFVIYCIFLTPTHLVDITNGLLLEQCVTGS